MIFVAHNLTTYLEDLAVMGFDQSQMLEAALNKGLWSDAEIAQALKQIKPKRKVQPDSVRWSPPQAPDEPAWGVDTEAEQPAGFRLPESRPATSLQSAEDLQPDQLGYAFSPLVQCALPYRFVPESANSDMPATSITKRAGRLTVTVGVVRRDTPVAEGFAGRIPVHPFIPYGGLTRLILSYMATSVIRTGSREIDLSTGASFLLSRLKITPTFGKRGSVSATMAQLDALRNTYMSSEFDGSTSEEHRTTSWKNMFLIESGELWFSANYQSASATLQLSPMFADALCQHAFPIDLYTLRALYDSPIAMDVYAWLSYHSATLRRATEFTWRQLYATSGSTSTNIRAFKQHYLQAMSLVRVHYNGWRADETEKGLIIYPAKPHVRRRLQGSIET